MDGLNQKIRSAYLWTTALLLTKNLLGFGLSLLLARFLSPADYGLVGMVTVLTGIVLVAQDWGMGQAVIYFDEDHGHLATYFTVAALTGAILTVATFLVAPAVGAIYHEPRLVPIMQVLSFTLLLGGLRSVSQGLLTKRFQFRSITLIEAGCTIGSVLIAVILAWKGFGAWSLVVNILLGAFLQTVLFCWLIRPQFTLAIDRVALGRAFRWGLPLTGASLLWQFYENSDYLVVGKLLGAAALGQYTMAFRLATVPNDKVSSVINRVSFPSFSAMQKEVKSVVEHWFSLTRKIGFLTFPALVALAVNAHDFIVVVLGSKWLPAAPIVKALCIVGALKSMMAITVNLVCARGRTDLAFRFSVLNAIFLPVSFLLGCKWASLSGVAVAWCVVFPLICLYLVGSATHLVGVRLRDYCRNLASPMLTGLICLAAMLPAGWSSNSSIVRLTLRSGVGLACFYLCLKFQPALRDSIGGLLVLGGAKRPTETGNVEIATGSYEEVALKKPCS